MKKFLEHCHRVLRRPVDCPGMLGAFVLGHGFSWGIYIKALDGSVGGSARDGITPAAIFFLIATELFAVYLSMKLAQFNSDRLSPYFGETDDVATSHAAKRITFLLGVAFLIALVFAFYLRRFEPRPSIFPNANRQVGQSWSPGSSMTSSGFRKSFANR